MTGPALDRVVEALHTHGSKVTTRNGETIAQCPAHEDGNPSLSVTDSNGMVLLHCFANCTFDDIITALNLTPDDLRDEPRAAPVTEWMPGNLEHVSTYDYTDANGNLVFQVLRGRDAAGGKQFLQRHPDSTNRSGWCWKLAACLGDRRHLPYRLPELVDGVRRGVPVWIAEGEKDADALRRLGVVATCNAGGAGKWRPEHAAWLKGAHVVIVRDMDEPGRQHQQVVARTLAGVAASVRLVEPAKGKDAYDHIAAGLTLEDFASVVTAPDAAPGEEARKARQEYGPSQDEKDTGKRSAAAVLVDLAHARDWGDTNLRSHQRIAARFATYGRGKVMFVHGAGWHRWDGTRWAPDANNAFTTRLLTELLTLSWSEAITDKDLQSDVRASMTAMGSRGVLELARSHEGLFAEHVDRDPWLLNCLNGTLDLHTMELRPHDPEDRITKVCGAAYRPEATADTWNYLVESSLPDADVRGFLQRWAGVALVGRVIEHVLVILTGEGRNGKGMIAHTIGKALGNADGYAITGAASMLVAGRYGDKPSAGELAAQYRLRGARWVVLSEIQRGARMDEATMKMLTGGDKIQAKRMSLDPVEFAPSHSLTMLANDLPVVDPDAKAVWDRLRVVPFTVDFSGREDKTLEERLESELEGVLAWCVAGLRDYLDRGRHLDEPDAVSARTDAYRDDNDALGRFIAEECIEHRAAHVSKADFAAAYAEWAEREREPKFGAKVIAARMGKRPGITERRADSRTREWAGIGLRHEDPESSPEPTPESEIALTRESVTCVTSSQSIPRKTIVGNHREHLTQVTQPTPATPVDQTVAEATPCRLHRDRPHPDACFTCAELAGQGWDA